MNFRGTDFSRLVVLLTVSMVTLSCMNGHQQQTSQEQITEITKENTKEPEPHFVFRRHAKLGTGSEEIPKSNDEPGENWEEALWERIVFRQIKTGLIIGRPSRWTWIFYRHPTQSKIRLYLLGQTLKLRTPKSYEMASVGSRLDGWESKEEYWGTPTLSKYEGVQVNTAEPTYLFTKVSGQSSEDQFIGSFPQKFRVLCKEGEKNWAIHVAKATVMHDPNAHRHNGNAVIWKPSAVSHVKAWYCHGEIADHAREKFQAQFLHDRMLLWVKGNKDSLGIEYVSENSDMTLQAWAFRWIPLVKN
jgi:hypothetical protein